MIIVSQNKEKSKKYNNIITISYDNDYETYEIKKEFWIVFIDGEDMGHYKTRERAKEVLQKIITTHSDFEYYKNAPEKEKEEIKEIMTIRYEHFDVYVMPEE